MNLDNSKVIIGITVTFVVIIVTLAVIMFDKAIYDARVIEKELQDQIGREVIVNKDTLEVVDYSLFSQTLYLSNETQININYLKKNDNN